MVALFYRLTNIYTKHTHRRSNTTTYGEEDTGMTDKLRPTHFTCLHSLIVCPVIQVDTANNGASSIYCVLEFNQLRSLMIWFRHQHTL